MTEGWLASLISRVLKVPAEPEPPLGSPGTLQVFNAAPGYYDYRRIQWLLKQLGTGFGIVFGLFVVLGGVDLGDLPVGGAVANRLLGVVEILAVGLFLLQIPVTYLMVRLDYRYRWYMTTDTSLRIREGITTVRERTMTFANIQNLSLRQGPLQRLFGIADLQVRTAGGGGAEGSEEGRKGHSEDDNMHLGYFRGVDNAEQIRDLVLGQMRRLRDSGLGDPDEVDAARQEPQQAVDDRQLLLVAGELLAEARRLKVAVGG